MLEGLCLVAGGSGFLGQNLVNRLLEKGYQVRVLSRRSQDAVDWAVDLGSRLDWQVGDFNQTAVLERALEGCTWVFHLVSSALPARPSSDAERFIAFDIGSSAVMLELCRQIGVRKVIFFSSGGTVYGVPKTIPIKEHQHCDPINSYGIQKLAIEKYMRLYSYLYGLETVSLRIANPYGPGQRGIGSQGFIGVACNAILSGLEIRIWGDGTVTRDYVHVDDVTCAAVLALERDVSEMEINIGSGVGTNLQEVLLELEQATGRTAKVDYMPGRPFDVLANVLDISKAKNVLGWEPQIGLRQGIEQLVKEQTKTRDSA
jgi:UDP-glucose 4-epimerase